jgi:hypothetical protein
MGLGAVIHSAMGGSGPALSPESILLSGVMDVGFGGLAGLGASGRGGPAPGPVRRPVKGPGSEFRPSDFWPSNNPRTNPPGPGSGLSGSGTLFEPGSGLSGSGSGLHTPSISSSSVSRGGGGPEFTGSSESGSTGSSTPRGSGSTTPSEGHFDGLIPRSGEGGNGPQALSPGKHPRVSADWVSQQVRGSDSSLPTESAGGGSTLTRGTGTSSGAGSTLARGTGPGASEGSTLPRGTGPSASEGSTLPAYRSGCE